VNETPIQKRDWYVDRQVKTAREAGLTPDVEAIAKETAALLSEVDRLVVPVKKAKPVTADRVAALEAKKTERQAPALAEQLGGKFVARDLPAQDAPRRIKPRTGVDQERYVALCQRIKLLCKRSTKRRLRYGQDAMDQADFEYPAFAMEIVTETMNCNMRVGIYKFLSTDDCRRVRDAALERIADRSNAAVGVGWWVVR
jgi:hypothetical protein